MIKNILTSLLLVLFISCGSDDNSNTTSQDDDQGQNTETFLTSYVFENFGATPEKFEYLFNSEEKIEKTYIGEALPSSNYNNYRYNADGKITSIDLYSNEGEIIERIYEFEYNQAGQLTEYTTYGAQNFPITTLVSYDGDTVDFVQQETGKTAQIVFESGRVITTIHDSGPNEQTRSSLSYDSDGLLSEVANFINNNPSYTIDFEFVDIVNPMYDSYALNEMAFLALNIFDMDYTGNYEPYTKNLRTKKTVTGGIPMVTTSTFEIGADGKVTSISMYQNEDLVNQQLFEYN